MYFPARKRVHTLGVIGREDGNVQAAVVRQRGSANFTPATPQEQAAGLLAAQQARAEIVSTLTPARTAPDGSTLYAANSAAELPPGARPIGVTGGSTILFAYPISTPQQNQTLIDAGLTPVTAVPNSPIVSTPIASPSVIAPTVPTADVPPVPNATTPAIVPDAPILTDSPSESAPVTASNDPWSDFLSWFRGSSPTSVNVSVPGSSNAPATAGGVEIVETGGIPGWIVLALGAGAFYLLTRERS